MIARRVSLGPTMAPGAIWTRRLALLGLVLSGGGVIWAHRPGAAAGDGLGGLATGLACACLAVACGFKAMATIWRTGQTGIGRVAFGQLIAAVVLAYPGFLAVLALGHPLTTAATTDNAAPPRFSRSTRAFALRGSVLDRPERIAADVPIVLDLAPPEAYAAVQKAVASLRWRSADAVPPGGRLGLGHIDAITFSSVMRLPQDLAIRLTPSAGGTRVDVLSAARLGIYDFGESAASIRQLRVALDADADD